MFGGLLKPQGLLITDMSRVASINNGCGFKSVISGDREVGDALFGIQWGREFKVVTYFLSMRIGSWQIE